MTNKKKDKKIILAEIEMIKDDFLHKIKDLEVKRDEEIQKIIDENEIEKIRHDLKDL